MMSILKILQALGGATALADRGLQLWAQKNNINLEKFKTMTEAQKATIIASVQGDSVRVSAQANVLMSAMNHRVWWIAWCLFVFPVGVYHASIFILSTFGVDPHTFAVLRVPPMQEETAKDIIKTIFALQAGTGVAAAALQSVTTIFKKE